MGGLDVKLYCCLTDMIRDVQTGELAIAYNVLGSYAIQQPGRDANSVVLPGDFTVVMLRTGLIPTSDNPGLAAAFIDFVLGRTFAGRAPPAALPKGYADLSDLSLQRIQLGPGLRVCLDRFKR